MYMHVSSDIPAAVKALGSDCGVIQLPNIPDQAPRKDGQIGGAGEALSISRTAKYPDAAIKFLSFLNSRDEQLAFLKTNASFFPIRNDITPEDLGWSSDPILSKLLSWAPRTIYWVDNILNPDSIDV